MQRTRNPPNQCWIGAQVQILYSPYYDNQYEATVNVFLVAFVILKGRKMNVLQKYLDQNNVTKYQVSKLSVLSQMTLSHATADSKLLSGQTVKVISAVAQALGKTPGQVLDDLIELDEDNSK